MALLLLTSALAGLAAATPVVPADLPYTVLDGIKSPDSDSIELTASRQTFVDIQKALGQDGYAALVSSAADAGDAYFKNLIATSDATQTPKASFIQLEAYAPTNIFNSSSILTWLNWAGSDFPNAFISTSPQHFQAYAGAGVSVSPFPDAVSEQLENWGLDGQEITTWYGAYELTEPLPYFANLTEQGFTEIIWAEMKLRDGTVFSHSNTGYKDLPQGGVGFSLTMYLPENTDQWVSDALTSHLTSEFINWLRSAYAWSLHEVYLK